MCLCFLLEFLAHFLIFLRLRGKAIQKMRYNFFYSPFFSINNCHGRLIIRDNYDDVSEYVANYVAKRINDFKPTLQRPFVLGLPTGSSPIGILYSHFPIFTLILLFFPLSSWSRLSVPFFSFHSFRNVQKISCNVQGR